MSLSSVVFSVLAVLAVMWLAACYGHIIALMIDADPDDQPINLAHWLAIRWKRARADE